MDASFATLFEIIKEKEFGFQSSRLLARTLSNK